MAETWRENLKQLRKQLGKTQADIASYMKTTHQTVSNWESGKSDPSLVEFCEISNFFGISMDGLFNDVHLIEKTRGIEKTSKSTPKSTPISTPNDHFKGNKSSLKLAEPGVNYGVKYGVRTPNIITVDSAGNENIVYVPVAARAGYLLGFGDPNYIAKLDSFTLPGLRNGSYRMFEVEGQSMAPTILHGDRLICKWVENFDNIRENRIHIVVTRDGIVAKRVLNRIDQRGKVVLKSDTITHRKDYVTYEINPDDILEIWYAIFKISGDLSEPAEIYTRVADLEAEMVEIRGLSQSFTEEIKALKQRLPKAK